MPAPSPDDIRKWGNLAGIGPLIVGGIVVGYLLGSWADERFGTAPWAMTAMTFLGAIGAFIEVGRLLAKLGAGGAKPRRRRSSSEAEDTQRKSGS